MDISLNKNGKFTPSFCGEMNSEHYCSIHLWRFLCFWKGFTLGRLETMATLAPGFSGMGWSDQPVLDLGHEIKRLWKPQIGALKIIVASRSLQSWGGPNCQFAGWSSGPEPGLPSILVGPPCTEYLHSCSFVSCIPVDMLHMIFYMGIVYSGFLVACA